MKKKIEAVILAILVVCFAFTSLHYVGVFDTDFSGTQLIFENDEAYRYYYDRLTENAKIAYTLVLPQIYEHTEKIEIPEITDEEFDALMYALSYDNPDLICYGKECEIKYEGRGYYFYPSYNHTKEECGGYRERFDEAVKKALAGINTSASDYEKELYVHDYICSVCKYEIIDENNLKLTAYDALVDGVAVCEGYARATQLLLSELGIENYLVIGEGKDENGNIDGHMWNIVNINGQNYHLDVTWDDVDEEDEIFVDSHIYFNVTDEFIKKNHYNIIPENNNCTSLDMNYYNVNGMLFTSFNSYAENQIKSDIYTNYINGINSCEFSFTNQAAFDKANKSLFENEGILDLIVEIEEQYGTLNYGGVQYVVEPDMYVMKLVFS